MKALILLSDIYSIICLTLLMKALIWLRDIYSIISPIDKESFDLTEGYLQYHRMYWYLWSCWGIFTVSSYVLIHLILLRDIYSIIVCIDTFGLNEGYLQYHRTYWYMWSYWAYLQYHRMYRYMWSYWEIFTVSSYVLIPLILLRDIYSIIVCIDTCGLTEGYLQYYRMYWYLWS